MVNTCKRSSKSRPASFFIAEAFEWNRRIVSLPNVGTCRYLERRDKSGDQLMGKVLLPLVELIHSIMAVGFKDSNQMSKCRLPYPQLKLVQEIWNKHGEEIESELSKS
jgi:hypothetical protein